MTDLQYKWYKSEAELPGLASQYAKTLMGGLLRKKPEFSIVEGVPGITEEQKIEIEDWINSYVTEDSRDLINLMHDIVWEQLVTSSGFLSVDYPQVDNYEQLDVEERKHIRPYPILWKAEEVINIQTSKNRRTGRDELSRIVFQYIDSVLDDDNPYHPKLVPTVIEHFLQDGVYMIQVHRLENGHNGFVDIRDGYASMEYTPNRWSIEDSSHDWKPDGDPIVPLINGETFDYITVWPLSSAFDFKQPMLTSIIDKEISLYNKLSRRNHLLYGASTYTPVVYSDMGSDDFDQIVSRGLGSWLLVGAQDRIETLTTPTDALSDLATSIESSLAEMSILGTRILNPEAGDPGVSVAIKNSIQLAQLGMMNSQISNAFRMAIKTMIRWHYNIDLEVEDLKLQLSTDFDPAPTSAEWMMMVTEWYQSRLIPRSLWLETAQRHDIIPVDYNDEAGQEDMMNDPVSMINQFEMEQQAAAQVVEEK